MTEDERIEAAAKAICERHGAYRWLPDFTEEAERQGDLTPADYRDMARLALKAAEQV